MDFDAHQLRKKLQDFLPLETNNAPILTREIKLAFAYFFLLYFNKCFNTIRQAIGELGFFFKERGWIDDVHYYRLVSLKVPEYTAAPQVNVYVENIERQVNITWYEYSYQFNNNLWYRILSDGQRDLNKCFQLFHRYDLIDWSSAHCLPKALLRYLGKKFNFTTELWSSPIYHYYPRYYAQFEEDLSWGAHCTDIMQWLNDEQTRFVVHIPAHNYIITKTLNLLAQRMQLLPTTVLLVYQSGIITETPKYNTTFKAEVKLPSNSYQLYRPSKDKMSRQNTELYIGLISNEPNFNADIKDICRYFDFVDDGYKLIPRNRRYQNSTIAPRLRVGADLVIKF